MNYNENFVKWITCFIFGMLDMIAGLLMMVAGGIIHIIKDEWTSEQTMLAICAGIVLILGIVCLGAASSAEMSWKLESKNKSEE